MNDPHDLIVIGAGPAGGEAALAASSAGLRVALVDEGVAPGGQVWRAPRTDAALGANGDADSAAGHDLRRRLAVSDVEILSRTQVWDLRPGFTAYCVAEGGAKTLTAPLLILATGAVERVQPFPGWTLPGVLGLAAATAIMKAEKHLPGRRTVVAGQGPLLIAVAAKAVALGRPPVAVVDLASRRDWLCAATGFAALPGLALRGAAWLARLRAARVPMFRNASVVAASGQQQLSGVTVRNMDNGTLTEIEADTLYLGNGLSPADELHRLLGAEQVYDPLRGGYRTVCDADRRASIPGLFVAGDGAGVHGALPSSLQGGIAGLAAALDHGALDRTSFERRSAPLRRRLGRAMRFADASCGLMKMREDSLSDIPMDTIVCRCEDVTRGEIEAAIHDGASDINQLKHFTRGGMGPCQGRMCGLNTAAFLRAAMPELTDDALRLTPRAPVRPVNMDELIGSFEYSDIPVPKPAPL